jgi:peptide deformylase
MKLIIQTGTSNEILRNVSTPVKPDEMKKAILLAEDMVKHIKNPDNGGVGLAAPQIGVNKRIIVVALMHSSDDETYKILGMINPVIIEHSTETCVDSEGCLSVPGEFGDVSRYKTVKLTYTDLK